jgi:excisionase family DNA binding protein
MDPVLLSSSDAARPLGVTPRTVRRLAASKRLAAEQVSGAWVIQKRDLEAYIAAAAAGTVPEASTTRAVCGN